MSAPDSKFGAVKWPNSNPTRRDLGVAVGAALGFMGLGVAGGIAPKFIWPQPLAPSLKPRPVGSPGLAPTPASSGARRDSRLRGRPFYTPTSPLRTNLRRSGHGGRDLTLAGRVLDTACRPLAGAVLDFWHVDETGVYDNVGYDYRGHLFTTTRDGRYELRTVVPHPYYFAGIWRAAHIHVKAQGPHTRLLTTPGVLRQRPGGQRAQTSTSIARSWPRIQTLQGGGGLAPFDFVLQTS